MNEIYRGGLQKHLGDPRFENPWPASEKGTPIKAVVGEVALEALVDPDTHRILRLHHHRVRTRGGVFEPHPPHERAPLNALCDVSLGRSVQDVSEHAAIRMENALRDRADHRPVEGVVQPENADPLFEGPLKLVRQLLKNYRDETGYKITMNFEEGPVRQASSGWDTRTASERMQRVRAALPAVCPETLILGDDVKVKDITGPRITVELPASASKEAQQRYLTLVELALRETVDGKIEIFLDDRRDANANRHATEEALGI